MWISRAAPPSVVTVTLSPGLRSESFLGWFSPPKVTEEVFSRIQDIRKRGVTVLIVEQNVVDALSIADRGYVVENGRVVMQGDATDLLRDEKVRAAYLGL